MGAHNLQDGRGLSASLVWRLLGLAAFLLALFPGCSPEHYRKEADREVYGIISAKQREVFGEERPFSVEQEKEYPLPGKESGPQEKGEAGKEVPAISLGDALAIAFVNNRDYQRQKEEVYIEALRLSLERDLFAPTFGAGISATGWRDSSGTEGAVSTDFNLSKLFSTGARLTVNLTMALSRFFTGDPRRAASSLVSIALVQPLLRGAGRAEVEENLTQAERNVIYQLRSFARFQQTFVVSIASDYFRVLQKKNVVENEWKNYQDLIDATRRSEMMAKAGRIPEFQVDQARQDELRARSRWVLAKEAYGAALDKFKITLGVPTDEVLDLKSEELERISEQGLIHPDVSLDEAVKVALGNRFDLMNERDRVEDARRKVYVAERRLKATASLVLGADIGTVDEANLLKFDLDKGGTYSAGLDLDLPLERTAERNSYRQALIDLERSKRSWSLSRDTVILDVRDAYRSLQQAKESFEIQKRSVELAQRRVESTRLLLQAGRAQTRDLLESQSALVEARNALTKAIVDHTIARLQFFRDIGLLEVDEKAPFEAISEERMKDEIGEGEEQSH